MNSVLTEYPVETLYDAEVDEIDALQTAEEVDSERAKTPASMILEKIKTIEWLREVGVRGDFTIKCGNFRIPFPEK